MSFFLMTAVLFLGSVDTGNFRKATLLYQMHEFSMYSVQEKIYTIVFNSCKDFKNNPFNFQLSFFSKLNYKVF